MDEMNFQRFFFLFLFFSFHHDELKLRKWCSPSTLVTPHWIRILFILIYTQWAIHDFAGTHNHSLASRDGTAVFQFHSSTSICCYRTLWLTDCWHSRQEKKGKMSLKLVTLALMLTVLVSSGLGQSCSDSEQTSVQKEFTTCLNKSTQKHHEAMGKAQKAQEFQVRNRLAILRIFSSFDRRPQISLIGFWLWLIAQLLNTAKPNMKRRCSFIWWRAKLTAFGSELARIELMAG